MLAAPPNPNPKARPIIIFSNLSQRPEPVLLATVSHLSGFENYTTAKMNNNDFFVDMVGGIDYSRHSDGSLVGLLE
jgi:hypothetical protein